MNDKNATIVIAVFNMVNTIERAILSVLDQTYKDMELIVMDGGSTDGTIDVIKKYSERLAYWESAQDGGPSDAISKALKYAKGKYIGFLGADDWYEPYALEATSKIIENEEADICYGNMAVHNGDSIEIKDLSDFAPEKLFAQGTQWLGAVCAFVKKDLLVENYAKRNDVLLTDYLFFLRLYATGKKFMYIGDKRTITHFSIGGRTTSLNYKVKKDSLKVREIILKEYPEKFCDNEKTLLDVLNTSFATDVEKYYRLILTKTDYIRAIGKEIDEDKTIILFGAGNMGRECAAMFQFMEREIECFVDNDINLNGKEVSGIKVKGADYLDNISGCTIVITSFVHQTELEKQLNAFGVNRRNNIRMYSNFARKIYDVFGDELLDEVYDKGLFM